MGKSGGVVRAEKRCDDVPHAVLTLEAENAKLGTHVLMQVVRWVRKNWKPDTILAEADATDTTAIQAFENAGFRQITNIDGVVVLNYGKAA